MTKQVRTTQDINQVDDDFDTFSFGADLSFSNNGNAFYGVTDSSVNLSMVNVRHLNATRNFRGIWSATPMDGNLAIPYTENQVVIGGDNHLYLRSANSPGVNPDPVTDATNAWTLLSAGLPEPVTELTTSDPVDVNLYHSAIQTASFTIAPSANAMLSNPSVDATVHSGFTGIIGPSITPQGALTMAIPAAQTVAGTSLITTESESTSVDNGVTVTHEGGQVDSIVNLVDARQAPEITPSADASTRVNLLDPAQSAVFNINLAPGSARVADGTAYAARWSARAGTMPATPFSATATMFTLPQITANTMITFNYDIPAGAANGQGGSTPPPSESRMVNVYTPWFWQFGGTEPTGIASMTEAVLVGDVQGNNFPIDNSSQISISSTITRTVQFLWLAVPSIVNRNITLNTGIASISGTRTPNAFTAREGTAFAQYDLYQFRIGLVNSPTIFNIYSTLIS